MWNDRVKFLLNNSRFDTYSVNDSGAYACIEVWKSSCAKAITSFENQYTNRYIGFRPPKHLGHSSPWPWTKIRRSSIELVLAPGAPSEVSLVESNRRMCFLRIKLELIQIQTRPPRYLSLDSPGQCDKRASDFSNAQAQGSTSRFKLSKFQGSTYFYIKYYINNVWFIAVTSDGQVQPSQGPCSRFSRIHGRTYWITRPNLLLFLSRQHDHEIKNTNSHPSVEPC